MVADAGECSAVKLVAAAPLPRLAVDHQYDREFSGAGDVVAWRESQFKKKNSRCGFLKFLKGVN